MGRFETSRSRVSVLGWPMRLSLIYAGAGALWILYSDRLVALMAHTRAELSWYQTYKGWVFVAVTAAMLYAVCVRFAKTPVEAPAPQLADDRRVRRLVVLVLAIFITTVLGNFSWSLQGARKDVLAKAHQTAENLTLALDQYTGSSFDAVELALAGIGRRVAAAPRAGLGSVDALMQESLSNLPFVRAIWVLDAEGTMIHDSGHLRGRHNLGDRTYFQVQRKGQSPELFIDVPTLSKHGLRLIPVSRRIEHADGRFAGVVVAGLEPEYLEAFYRSLDVGNDGVVGLLRTDGVLMHRSPPLPQRPGSVTQMGKPITSLLPTAPHG
ncbi:MAG: PDC sensor domain-containing protein, partial [Lysobacter sp.]